MHDEVTTYLIDKQEQAKHHGRATELYEQSLKLLEDKVTADDIKFAAMLHYKMVRYLTAEGEKAHFLINI